MNSPELDESLLTAYLDNELSIHDRKIVEEQLKVNAHWQQLLLELEGVRAIIRELPKPVLSRSLDKGPWSDVAPSMQLKKPNDADAMRTRPSRFSFSPLAIAASLLVGGLGLYAWLQSTTAPREVADVQISKDSASELVAPARDTAIEMYRERGPLSETSKAEAEPAVAGSLEGVAIKSLEMQQRSDADFLESATQPKEPLQAEQPKAKPLQARRFQLRSAAPPLAATAAVPEPIETYYANLNNRLGAQSFFALDQVAAEAESKTDQLAASDRYAFESISTPVGSTARYRWKSRESAATPLPMIRFDEGLQYEFYFQRSEWSIVLKALRDLDIDVSGLVFPEERMSTAAAAEGKSDASSGSTSRRPPPIAGPISDPGDWLRIIVAIPSKTPPPR